jgi:hypothetical protein
MMIALVTVAVFIYRKPFQHLFSSVGYGMIGSTERAEYSWREASFGFRRVSANAAGVAVPGVGAYRAARWARRNPSAAGPGGAAAMAGTAGEDVSAGGTGLASASRPGGGAPTADGHTTSRLRPDGPPPGGDDYAAGGAPAGGPGGSGGSGGGGRGRQWPEAGGGSGRAAPPLPLPPPGGRSASNGASPSWARGSARAGTTTSRSAKSAPAADSVGNGRGAGGGREQAQPPVRQNARGRSGSAPAGSSGWFAGGATGRSGDSNGAAPAAGEPSPRPFWLRPIRRGK